MKSSWLEKKPVPNNPPAAASHSMEPVTGGVTEIDDLAPLGALDRAALGLSLVESEPNGVAGLVR